MPPMFTAPISSAVMSLALPRAIVQTGSRPTSSANSTAARCFFFFQAEDGIRDVAVTGVQTCALPIFQTTEQRLAVARFERIEAAIVDQSRQQVEHRQATAGTLGNQAVQLFGGVPRLGRSEERRVGEEGRSRWSPDH